MREAMTGSSFTMRAVPAAVALQAALIRLPLLLILRHDSGEGNWQELETRSNADHHTVAGPVAVLLEISMSTCIYGMAGDYSTETHNGFQPMLASDMPS